MTRLESNSPVATYLSHFRGYYPGILEWYSGLKEELLSGRRSIFVSSNGPEVQALAITKNGLRGKLCHISVSPTVRDRGIGRTIMSLALSDMVCRGAREIHVTTSEEVFRDHAGFFRASGFRLVDWQLNRYRKGTSELIWKRTVDAAPLRSGLPALADTEHPREFCDEANSSASDTKSLGPLRRAFENWFSKEASSVPDESQSTNLSPACYASLQCSTLFSLSTPLQFLGHTSLLYPRIGTDKSLPGLTDCIGRTNSTVVEK